MPISMTAKSASRGMRAKVSGMPRLLFKLPMVVCVLPTALKAAFSISLVLVFPELPVTPTIFAVVRLRARDAMASKACLTSGTTIAFSGGTSAGIKDTRTPAAPFSIAAAA